MSINYRGVLIKVLGHASLRIETTVGPVCYIDPWSEVLGTHSGDADIILITHDDVDHYDPAAIETLATDATTVVVCDAIDTQNLSRKVLKLASNCELTVDGVDVRSVSAYNDPAGDHVDADGTPYHRQGEVVGLLLTIDGTTVYYASDTDFLPEHVSINADIYIPPIGGTYTMDRKEAAAAARAIVPDIVIPVHYDTFEAIETDVTAFEAELEPTGIRVERA